jgi:hypothetical protein
MPGPPKRILDLLLLLEGSLQDLDTRTSHELRIAYFVRALVVELHMDMAQSHVYARIYRKRNGDQRAYPDLASALTPTVRTPECEHIGWGTDVDLSKEELRRLPTFL